MGTYSDIAFAMKQEDFIGIKLLKMTELPKIFNEADVKEKIIDKNIYWKWNSRKWYSPYIRTDELDFFIDYLDKSNKEFGYINMYKDNGHSGSYEPEIKGEPYLFNLYIEIILHTPDLGEDND